MQNIQIEPSTLVYEGNIRVSLDQCFTWKWKSKTDHLLLYLRYTIHLLYPLSCNAVFVCYYLSMYFIIP